MENLEARICVKHSKPLELFCRTAQVYVCALCPVLDHKGHKFALLCEEFKSKKGNLMQTNGEIQLTVQKKREKVQEFQRSASLSHISADKETVEGQKVFTSLEDLVKMELSNFIKRVKETQKATERQVGDYIKELEQEISDLNQRSIEVDQLLLTEDPLHLLLTFKSLNMHQLSTNKDWTKVTVPGGGCIEGSGSAGGNHPPESEEVSKSRAGEGPAVPCGHQPEQR